MKILRAIIGTILVIAAFDLLILFAALGQIALEGRSGEWAPFWRVQAEAVINIQQWIHNK